MRLKEVNAYKTPKQSLIHIRHSLHLGLAFIIIIRGPVNKFMHLERN